ncbi:MAG: AIR synthase-related protein, partial [Thermodesulfobacteriota bacterium]|nr:AIR synthase-related protein [Thermodesulfobacteriota bacterium]
ELGGSELSSLLETRFYEVPQVDAVSARIRYHTLYEAIQKGMVSACHDLSDGGLGVAAAEMAIGGRLGAGIDLSVVPACPKDMGVAELLYSESNSRFLVCVPSANKSAFEALFVGQHAALVGQVEDTGNLSIVHGAESVLNEPVDDLVRAWQETLRW